MALSAKKKAKYMESLKQTDPLRYYSELAQSQADEARAANEKRYSQMMGIYDTITGQYAPGGGFMKGAEAGLERLKERDVASEVGQSISSGLYGTTVPSTAAKKWEEDIGAPQRLKLEDIRMERYAGALGQKAGAVERREDAYPDYSSIISMLTQSAAKPTRTYSSSSGSSNPFAPENYAFGAEAYYKKKAPSSYIAGPADVSPATSYPVQEKKKKVDSNKLVSPIKLKSGVQIGMPSYESLLRGY